MRNLTIIRRAGTRRPPPFVGGTSFVNREAMFHGRHGNDAVGRPRADHRRYENAFANRHSR